MPRVVMGAALGPAGAHRQQRLGAVERLDLRLLVPAEHQRALGRAHVEPDDVAHLLDEERVRRELEGLAPVRLQAEGAPDAVDGGGRVADRLGHRAQRPVGRARRRRLQGQADRLGDLVVADLARRTGPRLAEHPSRRWAAKRRRHFEAVLASAATSAQIASFSSPAAAASTIRARRAIACPVRCAQASDSSSRLSGAVSSIATAVLPIASPHHPTSES